MVQSKYQQPSNPAPDCLHSSELIVRNTPKVKQPDRKKQNLQVLETANQTAQTNEPDHVEHTVRYLQGIAGMCLQTEVKEQLSLLDPTNQLGSCK